MKTMVVLSLGIALFWPGTATGLWGAVLFIVKCSLFFLITKSLLRASVGRMRIDQAFIFYFKWPELLGVIGLLSVVLKN